MKILTTILQCGTDLPLNELDISGQCVEEQFLNVIENIRELRPFRVKHGLVLERFGDGRDSSGDPFVK